MRDGIIMKLIRKKKKIIWILAFLFISSLLSISTSGQPPGGNFAVVYVDPMGPVHSIQQALGQVADGGTIIVNPGTYHENINIDKPLTLQKNQTGSKPTIIGISTSKSTIEVSANNVHINGFEIQNPAGTPNNHHGIFLGKSITGTLMDVSDCSIQNCQITDAYWGIALRGSSNTVSTNTIFNTIEGGISIIRGNNNIINENILTDNNQGIRVGIGGSSSITQTQIQSNTITSTLGSYGINLGAQTSSSQISQNYLYNIENAIDQGTNNQWDNGAIGNWWSDYEGSDTNNNGIGDTPYQKNGVIDNYPTGRFQIAHNQPPIATIQSITPSTATYGQQISFRGTGFDADGDSITAYNWRSNRDGQLSNKASFTTTSLSVGTHIIYFKVYDGKEWSAEQTSTLQIQTQQTTQSNLLPTAVIHQISPNPASYGQTIQLQGYGTDQEHNIIQWKWTSSIDGLLGSQANITLNNLSEGTHTIYFQVKNSINQWSNHDTQQLIITTTQQTPTEPNQPIANAGGPYSGILHTEILFDASQSYSPNAETLHYSWDFGDGNTSNQKITYHSYNQTGTYTITLTIQDNTGNTITDSTTAIIYESLQHKIDSEGSPLFNVELSTPLVLLIPIVIILCIIAIFIKLIKKT